MGGRRTPQLNLFQQVPTPVNLRFVRIFIVFLGQFSKVSGLTTFTVQKIDTLTTSRQGLEASAYNFCMARGWESKAIEQQQDDANSRRSGSKVRLTPAQQEKQRQRQGLLLSRRRTEQQLETTQNGRHREILLAALAELDAQISRLD